MKIIGKTFENQKVYKLSDKVAVSEDGEILQIVKNEFQETIYSTNIDVKNASVEDVKGHIYLNEAIHIREFIINTVDNKINGELYIHIDYEDMDSEEMYQIEDKLSEKDIDFIMNYDAIEFVKYGESSFLIDVNETSYYNILDERDVKYLEAIEDAFDLQITEYEDFESFSKVKTDVKTFNCTITKATWVLQGDHLTFHITANRFLRNMVRAIVGTLIEVGMGKISLADFRKIIESKNRSEAGLSVPARGLFLTEVCY